MNSACQAFREGLHDPQGSADAHLADCPDCVAFAARIGRAAGALGELERMAVPAELDGRVVAALQAGARQDRAVRVLEGLAPAVAPERIDDAVAARLDFLAKHPEAELPPARLNAPNVLERLVGEEMADPSAARARRFVTSLPRLEAPEALASRLHQDLSGTGVALRSTAGGDSKGPADRRRRLGFGKALGLAAAALALVMLTGPLRDTNEALEGPEPRARRFQMRAASLEDLQNFSPMGRDLVAGLNGGLLVARPEGEAR